MPKLGESLADLFPAVAAQWHPFKNGELRPTDLIVGSETKVWWKCPEGIDHVWAATVAKRSRGGRGCPYCVGQKVSVTNCLSTVLPELVKEWHPEKNGELKPTDLTLGTNKKVWWKCPEGDDHEWEAPPNARKQGKGCPFCSGHKVAKNNRLSALRPEIAAQWHPRKNLPLTPDDVTVGSNKKFWWKCDVAGDHEWVAYLNARTSHDSGCPMCAGRLASVTNSVESLFPELADEWHPDKNGGLLPSQVSSTSHKKIWWQCPKGPDHEWLSECRTRTGSGHGGGGYGCPFCDGKRVSVTNSLRTRFPDLASQWHPTKNGELTHADVTFGSPKGVWWQCPVVASHEWKVGPSKRTGRGDGCPECTLTPRSAQEIRLAHELVALIDFDLDDHKLRFAGRLRDVDVLIEDLKVAVEFDGAYWHRNKGEKDLKKTEQIETEGWKVIRVRERPLESIHTNDVMVEPLTPVKDVADLVLKQIEKVTKTKIPNLETYLASKQPWREEEALAAIRAYQAERAAAKAERAARRAVRSSKKI